MEVSIIAYHVTFKHLLKTINKIGLIPQKPQDVIFDELEAVFLFKTKEDATNALLNWLGERIEDLQDELDIELEECLLTVDLTGLEIIDTVEYEWACLETIIPNRILLIEKI